MIPLKIPWNSCIASCHFLPRTERICHNQYCSWRTHPLPLLSKQVRLLEIDRIVNRLNMFYIRISSTRRREGEIGLLGRWRQRILKPIHILRGRNKKKIGRSWKMTLRVKKTEKKDVESRPLNTGVTYQALCWYCH